MFLFIKCTSKEKQLYILVLTIFVRITQGLKDHDLSKTDPGTATHFYAGLIWFVWLMKDAGSTEFIANVNGYNHYGIKMDDAYLEIRK